MLLGQQRRRHQYRHLFSAGHHFKGRAKRHFGFAIPHVAAQKPVHWLRRLEVGFDVRDSLSLVLGFLIRKLFLQLPLPFAVFGECVAFQCFALGLQPATIVMKSTNDDMVYIFLFIMAYHSTFLTFCQEHGVTTDIMYKNMIMNA